MYLNYAALAVFLGIASALPGGSDPATYSQTSPPNPPSTYSSAPPSSPTYTPTYVSSLNPIAPTYVSSWSPIYTSPGGDCGSDCGGVCGDGVVQAAEECDLGAELNNTPGSGCDSTCHKYSCCGDGVVEAPEECDAGP
jgi:cysteine-rich repeat protein